MEGVHENEEAKAVLNYKEFVGDEEQVFYQVSAGEESESGWLSLKGAGEEKVVKLPIAFGQTLFIKFGNKVKKYTYEDKAQTSRKYIDVEKEGKILTFWGLRSIEYEYKEKGKDKDWKKVTREFIDTGYDGVKEKVFLVRQRKPFVDFGKEWEIKIRPDAPEFKEKGFLKLKKAYILVYILDKAVVIEPETEDTADTYREFEYKLDAENGNFSDGFTAFPEMTEKDGVREIRIPLKVKELKDLDGKKLVLRKKGESRVNLHFAKAEGDFTIEPVQRKGKLEIQGVNNLTQIRKDGSNKYAKAVYEEESDSYVIRTETPGTYFIRMREYGKDVDEFGIPHTHGSGPDHLHAFFVYGNDDEYYYLPTEEVAFEVKGLATKEVKEVVKAGKKKAVVLPAKKVKKVSESEKGSLLTIFQDAKVRFDQAALRALIKNEKEKLTVSASVKKVKENDKAVEALKKKEKSLRLLSEKSVNIRIKVNGKNVKLMGRKGEKVTIILNAKELKALKDVYVADLKTGKKIKAKVLKKTGGLRFRTESFGTFVIVK